MFFEPQFWFIIGFVLAVCAIGFLKYVYFISIGYGLSISAVGIALLAIYWKNLTVVTGILCALLVVYGFRLGGFLLIRELKSKTYNEKMKHEISDGKGMPFFVKIMLWLSCVLLYLFMTAPVIYRMSNGGEWDVVTIVGLCIMALGVLTEVVSDKQKSMAKKKNPNTFCASGLFKIVRCPNYLGELILWTGVLISGVTTLCTVGQWIVSVIGYLGIVYVMFSGARRLELRQDRTYGADPQYQAYVKKTPIILPLVPLYSVKKHKWLVG